MFPQSYSNCNQLHKPHTSRHALNLPWRPPSFQKHLRLLLWISFSYLWFMRGVWIFRVFYRNISLRHNAQSLSCRGKLLSMGLRSFSICFISLITIRIITLVILIDLTFVIISSLTLLFIHFFILFSLILLIIINFYLYFSIIILVLSILIYC